MLSPLQYLLHAQRALQHQRPKFHRHAPLQLLHLQLQRGTQILKSHGARQFVLVHTLLLRQEFQQLLLKLPLHVVLSRHQALFGVGLPKSHGVPQTAVPGAGTDSQGFDRGAGEPHVLLKFVLQIDQVAEGGTEGPFLLVGGQAQGRGEGGVGGPFVLAFALVAAVSRVVDDGTLDAEVRVATFPRLRIQDPMHGDAAGDAVVADVLDPVARLFAHLLQVFQLEQNAGPCERALLGRVTHAHHESLRAVHEDVGVHLAVARFEDVEHVFGIGRVHDASEGEQGQNLGSGGRRGIDGLHGLGGHGGGEPGDGIDAPSEGILLVVVVEIDVVVVVDHTERFGI
mmetsp:Transcript_24732/g.50150  ORF Transcript_24732/g.50150 Transcript_24732/m.50150 type:complete len:341 (+) Transcript_24732:487-1509(+)